MTLIGQFIHSFVSLESCKNSLYGERNGKETNVLLHLSYLDKLQAMINHVAEDLINRVMVSVSVPHFCIMGHIDILG